MLTSIPKHPLILALAGTVFASGQLHAQETQAPRSDLSSKPNIIVIYTDDQGWGDVGYHGFDDIYTPNIDALAAGGVHFPQAYVTASVCSPSRAGLLTGVYQQRFGVYGNFKQNHVPQSQPLMMEAMKDAGYTTGLVGKWHMGDPTGRPNERGADFFYGFHGGSHNYMYSDAEEGGKPWLSPLYRNTDKEPPIQNSNGYLTELFTDEAVAFIQDNADKPFFLHVAHFAVHHPWQVPDGYIERLQDLEVHHEERRFFAAQTLVLDDGVGAIMDTLKAHDLDQDTLVFFMSDNGTPAGQGFEEPRKKKRGETTMSSPGPFNGFKGDTYEGGIRVPFVIHYPAQIPAGLEYTPMVSALDIFPTMMARLGKDQVGGLPFDGVDLFPYILGDNQDQPHQTLYWRRDNDYAIRDGDWKLTLNDANGPSTIRLFNIAQDPGEWNDLVDQHPEIAQKLQNKFDAWESTLPVNKLSHKPENRNSEFHRGVETRVQEFNQSIN